MPSTPTMTRLIIATPGRVDFEWCRDQLAQHNPDLAFVAIGSAGELSALRHEELAQSRLIAFCTDVIIPKSVLDVLGFGAINFHPGSPAYPGWCPACFAAYEDATEFGATAHLMVERVDSGTIIATNLFPVQPPVTLEDLDFDACMAAGHLLMQMARDLALYPGPFVPLATQWSGTSSTKARLAKLSTLTAQMTDEERARRRRAVGAFRIVEV